MVAAPDLGSGVLRRGGSSPFIRTNIVVVQLVERYIWDVEVAGSSPAYYTKGPIAQLARASALHAEGQGFDSLWVHKFGFNQ